MTRVVEREWRVDLGVGDVALAHEAIARHHLERAQVLRGERPERSLDRARHLGAPSSSILKIVSSRLHRNSPALAVVGLRERLQRREIHAIRIVSPPPRRRCDG